MLSGSRNVFAVVCLILGLSPLVTTAQVVGHSSVSLPLNLPVNLPNQWPLLKETDLDLSHFPPPPQEGDERDSHDLRAVLSWQSLRNEGDCQRALREVTLEFDKIFVAPHGPISAVEAHKLQNLYANLFDQADLFVNQIKSKYQRPRPFTRTDGIKLCTPSHPSTSYPSGHATISRLVGRVLSQIFPEREQMIMLTAENVAIDRVIAGVHHPSDIEAGQALAEAIYKRLQALPEYRKEIETLRRSMSEEK